MENFSSEVAKLEHDNTTKKLEITSVKNQKNKDQSSEKQNENSKSSSSSSAI